MYEKASSLDPGNPDYLASLAARYWDLGNDGWADSCRYARDFDPELASIRNEPEFKAIFADIERDMARQRAALAARPKDAPLDLATTGT